MPIEPLDPNADKPRLGTFTTDSFSKEDLAAFLGVSHVATGVEARVIADITERQQRGIAKYGTTVEDNPLALRQWAQHFYEELLDGAVYAKKVIEKIEEIDHRIGSEFVLIDTARMQLLTHLDVLGHRYLQIRDDLEKMRFIVLSLPNAEDGKV